ncbi:hypothetical protein BDN71DRAFT_1064377 [Pleurotus eryngii]|uniref:Uncharacterized protein n=1 Tax=Pleurotus eryngii TaxID=5323 RepID=A0A9P5ZXR4_PLEER|nr:hypothetical protein BDN71DRAFT_1064377 [Pleurotus eryngii]
MQNQLREGLHLHPHFAPHSWLLLIQHPNLYPFLCTPGAQPPWALALIVGETLSSVLVSMPLEDLSMMAQLITSAGNCQRTNQALIGTNVSMLLMAVLFFTY